MAGVWDSALEQRPKFEELIIPMNQAEIEQVFRSLQLETEEQRLTMRFEPLLIETATSVQVITTDGTCLASTRHEPNVA